MKSAAVCCFLLVVMTSSCRGTFLAHGQNTTSLCDELARVMRCLRTPSVEENWQRAKTFLHVAALQVDQIGADLHHNVANYFRAIDRPMSNHFARAMPGFPASNPLRKRDQSVENSLCTARELLKEAASDWSRAERLSHVMRRLNMTQRLTGQPACYLRLALDAIGASPDIHHCPEGQHFRSLPDVDTNNYIDLAFHKVTRVLHFLSRFLKAHLLVENAGAVMFTSANITTAHATCF